MQFRLSDIAAALFLTGILLSGMVNNGISFLCALCAFICWVESNRLQGKWWFGMLAVIAWFALAASCSVLAPTK